ncbi:MAG: response regulator transcription factor [Caldilineaceae bacterium]|nr:response regulator transcription factor [Caldilineaceae bacterium]
MPKAELLRVLYAGRRAKLVHELKVLLNGTDLFEAEASPHYPASPAVVNRFQWECTHVTNQKAALTIAASDLPPDVVLVELERKPKSRVRFCEILRHRLPNSAMIAVTDSPLEPQFEFDDVLRLPLGDQPVARLLYSAWHKSANQQLDFGPIHLDVAKRTVATPSGHFRMTPKQCALLKMLITKHGMVVKRSEIMSSIWETSYLEDTRTLDVHVRWLRERIEPDPSSPIFLLTVRGVGYHLQLPEERDGQSAS